MIMGEREYYTLDQLAGAAEMTARNVRAYQTRGLLPSPVRDGRSAVYDHGHLIRLIQIRRLRSAQVSLRMILKAITNGESLDVGGPLYQWATGQQASGRQASSRLTLGDGTHHAVDSVVDAQVLEQAEQAVPGVRACLTELRLLWIDPARWPTCWPCCPAAWPARARCST
jgi:DNA-binding transcriptional MerR regulator